MKRKTEDSVFFRIDYVIIKWGCKMKDSYAIRKSLGCKPEKIIKNILGNIDSISNVVGNKKISIYEYHIYIHNKKKIMIGKWKSRSIIKNGAILLSDKKIKSLFILARNHKVLGYNNSYYRESYVYENIDSILRKYLTKMYGSYTNKFIGKNFILLDKFGNLKKITKKDLMIILDSILAIHIFYYNHEEIVDIMKLNHYSSKDYKKCKKTLDIIFDSCKENNIKDYGITNYHLLKKFIKEIDLETAKYEFHKTLTHNDFSNRNIYCSRGKCYFFDWELACYQNPEHDLIDVLVSNLEKLTDKEIIEYIKYYKKKLLKQLNIKISGKEYLEIIRYNLMEYMVNKLSMLRVFNKRNNMEFIDNLSKNSNRLLNLVLKEKKI